MEITIVERPALQAVVLKIPRDGSEVRRAWKIVHAAMADHPALANREYGLVFIPEWQWETEVTTLWVGVEVRSLEGLPGGFETISIPARKYAKVTVVGNRQRMDETYGSLFEWFDRGEYERDVSEGSLGFEENRLHPVNPFDIPADEIAFFDYDIYAPIAGRRGERA
ncbi:GyrI-like domain-containing protein [Cohnella nanjingensis]|uniref:GyrI-like domain-containing protein n=1 Tax=Cohnella nanjingensis TaxID=1387779 RepID=A0A7X0RRF4_9BACL|nr:GyrI-like domain-containing protein [Cohnella nanjingensis]MBB6671055.1 GyrI-like domain-containing protein [Cohnella nanjingensis]